MQTLPPELRNRIYELCLPELESCAIPCKEPALLRTCHLIRDEAKSLFWGNIPTVSVLCRLKGPKFQCVVETLAFVVKTCGKTPFKKISFKVRGPTRPYLINLLPLLEMMRATGFDPTDYSYEPRPKQIIVEYDEDKNRKLVKFQPTSETSIFHMGSWTHGALQEDLETAFALPRRAREEGWTAERLGTEFKAFVKRQGRDPKPKKAKPKSKKQEVSVAPARKGRLGSWN